MTKKLTILNPKAVPRTRRSAFGLLLQSWVASRFLSTSLFGSVATITMKQVRFSFISLALLLAGFGCAKERRTADLSACFMYPHATLVAESGSTKTTIPIAGNTSPRTEEPSAKWYAGGHKFDTGALVSWELVGKTLHGDVYLIGIQRPGLKEEITPVLFKGFPQDLAQFSDLHVAILPEHPQEHR